MCNNECVYVYAACMIRNEFTFFLFLVILKI